MAGNAAARTSWLVALKAVGTGPLNNLQPPTPNWAKLRRQMIASVVNLVLFSLLSGTCLAFIEGNELSEAAEVLIEESLVPHNNTYLRWLASIYIITTTVTTVGYGDLVPLTSGGKWFVMASCTLGFVIDIVCILRVSELINACMATFARRMYSEKSPSWFNPACLLALLIGLALLNATGWMMLSRLNAPEFHWSFTDACWFSWATFTTVGFGDFSPASSRRLNLPLLLSYLLITILGLAIMTSFIESVVEFVTDIRAAKEAAKLAGAALQKSRDTVKGGLEKALSHAPVRQQSFFRQGAARVLACCGHGNRVRPDVRRGASETDGAPPDVECKREFRPMARDVEAKLHTSDGVKS